MRRYTSLGPLQPALWQTALESLASSDQADSLAKWLQPQDSSRQTRTERAAILLGNLVEAAGPSLQVESCDIATNNSLKAHLLLSDHQLKHCLGGAGGVVALQLTL